MEKKSLFKVTVLYDKETEGQVKKTRERYAVDAAMCSDAENAVINEVSPYVQGDVKVIGCTEEKYTDSIDIKDTALDKFFKVRARMVFLDEQSGTEKTKSFDTLVRATCLPDALDRFNAYMKESVTDFYVYSVSELPYTDYINAAGEED